MSKTIVFFSDLEGTLISETGEIDNEQFYKFGEEMQRLAVAANANVEIALVSPIGPIYMTQIIDKMEDSLALIGLRSLNKRYHVRISEAAADFNDLGMDFSSKIDRRIISLPSVPGISRKYNTSPSYSPNQKRPSRPHYSSSRAMINSITKRTYVSNYVKYKNENVAQNPGDSVFYIYAGNGENDFSAMAFVKTLKNGLTITPANTIEKVSRIANIKSKYDGVVGVTDCIRQFREKRFTKEEYFQTREDDE